MIRYGRNVDPMNRRPINHIVQWVVSHYGRYLPLRWVKWASDLDLRR